MERYTERCYIIRRAERERECQRPSENGGGWAFLQAHSHSVPFLIAHFYYFISLGVVGCMTSPNSMAECHSFEVPKRRLFTNMQIFAKAVGMGGSGLQTFSL